MAETPASVVPGLDLESEPSSTAAQLKATTEATQATLSSTAVSTSVPVDPELEEIKKKVREMEAEAKKLADMQKEVEMAFEQSSSSGPGMPMSAPVMHQPATPSVMFPSLEEKIEADARSIYVGQVEYAATAEEVELHFRGCGALNRVTILCDKFTGHPKGYAYIEFADKESVETAMALDGSYFKGRPIKVMPKRTNKPGISVSERGVMRSRGRGRGRGRGMIRGRGGRGRGRGGYGMGMRGGHNLYSSPYQL